MALARDSNIKLINVTRGRAHLDEQARVVSIKSQPLRALPAGGVDAGDHDPATHVTIIADTVGDKMPCTPDGTCDAKTWRIKGHDGYWPTTGKDHTSSGCWAHCALYSYDLVDAHSGLRGGR